MGDFYSRRAFIRNLGLGLATVSTAGILGFDRGKINSKEARDRSVSDDLWFKISLAQWSLNRAFFAKELDAREFASIAKNRFGISAIEYVNAFYVEKANDSGFWNEMNSRAKDKGVDSLLIMVDDEGDLGDTNDLNRKTAVQNHFKWMDAAKHLDCHSIRINAFGKGTADEVGAAMVDGLGALCEYAGKVGINVLIENHGLYSSDGKWVVNVIKQVNMDNCGTLPDFGNFCTAKKWGSTQDNECDVAYDRYLGVLEMLPFARGVSAKSYDFNEAGDETIIDYHKLLKIVYDAGYMGHIGIEYEGNRLSEPEGIEATKQLLMKAGMAAAKK